MKKNLPRSREQQRAAATDEQQLSFSSFPFFFFFTQSRVLCFIGAFGPFKLYFQIFSFPFNILMNFKPTLY